MSGSDRYFHELSRCYTLTLSTSPILSSPAMDFDNGQLARSDDHSAVLCHDHADLQLLVGKNRRAVRTFKSRFALKALFQR